MIVFAGSRTLFRRAEWPQELPVGLSFRRLVMRLSLDAMLSSLLPRSQ
ncbi:hypothetical protein [Synechococcus sp. MIT S9509]